MPYIKRQHIRNLSQAFENRDRKAIVGSGDDDKIMPPAIFPSSQFSALQNLRGDQGARKLLQTAHLVSAPEGSLLDIDTPEILAIENREEIRR
jgi:molybdenum cofactor cytidylyltransferase